MRKKILSVALATIMVASMLTGCGNKDNKTDGTTEIATEEKLEIVYENEYVKVAQYKGLEYELENTEVTEDDLNYYVESIVNGYYQANPKNEEDTTQEVTTEATATDSTEAATTEAADETTEAEDTAESTDATDATEATTEATTEVTIVSYSINEITDEMLKEATGGEYSTVKEYKEYLKAELSQQYIQSATEQAQSELFTRVLDNSEMIKYEDADYEKYYSYSDDYYREYAEYLGVEWATFLTDYIGVESEEAYKTMIDEEAKYNVKTQYIIQAIAENENITATDEDVDKQIQSYIDSGNFQSEDDVLAYITKDEIKLNVIYYQILDLITDNAVEANSTTETTTEATTEQ